MAKFTSGMTRYVSFIKHIGYFETICLPTGTNFEVITKINERAIEIGRGRGSLSHALRKLLILLPPVVFCHLPPEAIRGGARVIVSVSVV
ncbi:unnamed protein product [Cylicostephanus goldi]|uniref:Uncharacterized protein n=1 Tax=Cylicostephanus goldi TaxID=71465 RepID=A0A3P6TXD8_CYLGO|nr:unnamed protein product [Cylicostephanus goldi]